MLKKIKSNQLQIAYILFVTLLFFFPVLFGKVLFFGDTLTQRVPGLVFWKQQVLSGQLPLWNPYLFAGNPHFADLSTNTLSPFNLIFLFPLHPLTSLSILTILLVLMSGFWSYLFLIQLTKDNHASLLGGIIFSFSGSTLAATNDLNSLQGIVLIPLIFWLCGRIIKNPTPRNFSIFSLGLTLQFFSSHPQYIFYTWSISAIYLFSFLKLKLTKRILTLFLSYVLAILLVSIQLLPFIELTNETFRPTTTEFSTQNSFTILDIPRLILAHVYGTWESGTSWGPNSPLEVGRAGSEGYIGIIPLLIIMYGVLKVRTKTFHFFAAASIIIFVLSFGPNTPLFQILTSLVPFIDKFRSPVRILVLYSFTQSILVALAVQKIFTKKS